MKGPKRERGAVLLVSLFILMLVTLFVVSSANMNSAELRIVGNYQTKSMMAQSAQQAIEQVLSDVNNFNNPAAQNINVNGIAVTVSAPQCIVATTAAGYTAVNNISLYDTNWLITATATDSVTGAVITLSQGARIRMPSNYCP
jgi:Tfp pilus assembly protein PilX